MVYAGRGDAMIVEDGDKLYLLDGGPQGYMTKGQATSAASTRSAPYYRYYMSALRAVSREMNRSATEVAPDAVIVSHAHEDHYGGIAAIFKRFLAPKGATQPTPEKPLVFNGPLVTQILRDQMDIDEGTLTHLIGQFAFSANQSYQGPLFQAFKFAENAPLGYSVYSRPATLSLGRTRTVDTDPDNLASVLMFHRSRKMVFTGDSAGYLVAPFVADCVSGPGDKSLSIFKVPHHGSMRNSQRGELLGTVPVLACQQYALLCIGSARAEWDRICMPLPLRLSPGDAAAAAKTLDEVATGNRVVTVDLINALRTAFDQTILNIQNGDAKPFVFVGKQFLVAQIWHDLYLSLAGQALATGRVSVPGRGTKRSREATLPPLSPSWFGKLTPELFADVFLAAMAFQQLKSFFAGLQAKNYVISADSSYRHPSVETLAAISVAAAQANRKVCVFVTDGYAVNLDRLGLLAPQWPTSMSIRYLNKGARIVLDMSALGNAEDPALLDPLKTTVPIASGFRRDELHDQFQKNRAATIPERTLPDDKFQFRVEVGGQTEFLKIADDLTISLSSIPQSFNLDEAWTLSLTNPGLPPYPASFDDIRVRIIGSTAPRTPTRLLRLVAPPGRGVSGNALMVPAAGFGTPPSYVCTDASQKYLTTDFKSPALAIFSIVKVTALDARRPLGLQSTAPRGAQVEVATPVTLRAFCQAVGVPTAQPLSCLQVLPQLVGPVAADTLIGELALHVIERVLGWSADLDRSTVEYTLDEYGPLLSAASIAIELGVPLTFTVEDQQETIASATVTIARDATEALTMSASVTTTTGIVVGERAQMAEPTRTRPLDQYLHEVAMDPASWSNLTLGTLLSAFVGAQANAEDLLLRAPSFIAGAGIAEWLLDHAASQVQTQRTASGDTEIVSARIVAQTPSPIHATIEGFTLAISKVVLSVADARLPGMEVALQASATVASMTLAASAPLTRESCTLELSLPGSANLTSLLALLPGSPDLGALVVPLANSSLSALSLSSPGIVLRQPGPGAEPYELVEVYGTVSFSGWQRILPSGWPAPSASSLNVRILNPLDSAQRQLALAVEFEFAIGQKTLTAELSAEPLADSTQVWSYTLSAYSDPAVEPCTITELLGAVGLGGPLQSLNATLPALGEVSSKLALGELTLALELAPGAATIISSFAVGLVLLEGWEILPGILTLGAVQVDLSYEGDAWEGGANADAVLGGLYPVSAEIELPTSTAPGAVSFSSASPELTIVKLIQLCGLGDLSQVPVLGTLLSIAVSEVELQLVYPTGSTQPALAAVAFSLAAGEQLLGWLQLSALSLAVERRLLDAAGKPAPSTSFWLEAQWDTTKVVSLSYDTVNAELKGQLRMTGPETIAELLSKLLGSTVANALLPLIGQFKVRDGSIALHSTDFSLISCAIRLDTSAVLEIGSATVSELSVSYTAAKDKQPQTYELLGTITGTGTDASIAIKCQAGEDGTVSADIESTTGTTGVTATGLLGMLGLSAPSVPEPEDAPKFFDLKLTHAGASFSLTPGLQLQTLNVSVVSTATLALLSSPAITLTGLALEVNYDRTASPTMMGFITGQLQIGDALVTVKYVQGKDGEAEFQASLETAGDHTPDFASLIASGSYGPGYGLPSGLGIPAQIPMARLTVVARPGKFVDVAGYKDTTSWDVALGALKMNVLGLGGRVKLQAPAQTGGSASYEVTLFGQLAFNGFVSASALFSFGSNRNSVLSASATSSQGAIQLPVIAGALGSPWTDVVPAATTPVSFGDAAYVYVDLSSGLFALYGSLTNLGSAALLSVERAGKRSYVFVFGLAQPFTFASLLPTLKPVNTYLSVTAANAAVLAYDGTLADLQADLKTVSSCATLQGIEFEAPFGDLPALNTELPATTPLPQGFALFASLELHDGSLSEAVGKILNDTSTAPSLLLWAVIDHTAPPNTTYTAELSDLVLLGGRLTLDGTATYRPNVSETLVVDAQVGVALSADGTPYVFHGTLTVAEEKAAFVLAGANQPTQIVNPFGGMFGVKISSPRLTFEYEYPAAQATRSTISISGNVTLTIASKPIALDGLIYFVDGVPVVAAVAVTVAMPVFDLFANVISGAAWPAGYAAITLINASLYYADIEQGSITIVNVEYLSGYHVACDVYFFGALFHVDVGVTAKGVLVSGVYVGQVELVIAQLTAYIDPNTKQLTQGPTATIDTRESSGTVYELACGISVFKQPFLSTSFSYQPTLQKYAGKATYEGEIVGVLNPNVSFTYSDSDGLQITNWPLEPVLGKVLEYAEMLKKASEGTSCGELIGLMFDKPIETSFSLKLSQGGKASTGSLPLILAGEYTVTVAGKQLFTLGMPELDCSITAPGSFEFEELALWVLATLLDNAVSIGRSLLADTFKGQKALKILIAEFTVTKFTPELLANLICREADATNVRDATNKTIDDQIKAVEDPADGQLVEVTNATNAVTAATTMAGAATGFADAATALGVLGASVAALVGLIEAAWAWLTKSRQESKKKAEEDREKAELAVAGARAHIVGLIAMRGQPTGSFKSETELEVSFTDANLPAQPGINYEKYEHFSFNVQVATDAQFTNVLGSAATTAPSQRSLTVTAAALASADEAHVRVRAVYVPDPHNTFEGAWIVGAPCHKHTLPAPSGLRALYLQPEGQIQASWNAPTPLPTSYEAQLTDAQGKPLSPSPTIVLGAGPNASISGPAIVLGGSYRLRVRGVLAGYLCLWSDWLALQGSAVAVPGNLQLAFSAGALHASWDLIVGASPYLVDLRLLDGDMLVAHTEPAAPPVAFGPASHVPLVPGAGYSVSVRAMLGSSVGPPGVKSAIVPTLLALVQSDCENQVSATAAANDATALLPAVGPAQLFDTLHAAGYPLPDVQDAVEAALPNTTRQQIEAIRVALTDTLSVLKLLLAEGVQGATIVALCHAIYGSVAVELAIALKRATVPEVGLAEAFSTAFGLTIAETTKLVGCVYTESWLLGGELHAAWMVSPEEAVSMLREAYPALVLVQAMATLKAGDYQVSAPDLQAALNTSFSPTPQQYTEALNATCQDTTGDTLAVQLHAAAVGRTEATSYVSVCWSALNPQQVQAAINAAYGPPQS